MSSAITPVIITPNLRLRAFTADDFAACQRLWAGEQVAEARRLNAEQVWSKLLRHLGHWQLMGYGYWALEVRSSGQFIGSVGLAYNRRDLPAHYADLVEAGWTLLPEAQGKGYATEAARAVLAWADQQLQAGLFCIIDPDNLRSQALAKKLGFHFAEVAAYGHKAVWLYRRGEYRQPD
ncbi:GNAT family N-acetyltransferase [Pantoea sp. B65]|uniref:GNAT family N-acetyltransferase n=1 Tax=Pantoea sp. B65 TaxID=2813359 RepID=UPI0039B61D8C